jgi:transcriptional regulator with XRE-family HTH domain
MADLSEALDAALRARYRLADIKTPATQRRGLIARMDALEKLSPSPRKGTSARQAAEAAGIPARTWRNWRAGKTKPSARNLRKLEGAYARRITVPAFRRALADKKYPAKVRVTGTIRWTDSPRKMYNSTRHRTTELVGMRGVMHAVVRAWAMAGPQAAADAFERGASAVYRVPPDDDGTPGIKIEGDQVRIEFS